MIKDLSRRQFLQRSAGVTGALVASRTILLDPELYPTQAVAASDRVRFGIIGIGMQGSALLTNSVELPGVECVAACDLYDGRHTLAKEIAGAKITTRGATRICWPTRKSTAWWRRFRITGTSRWWWTR